MKILVIFTGGTIGSMVSDGWISPAAEMKYLLIEKYRESTGDDMHFDTLTPYTILSENLMSENVNLLIKCVRENIEKYDGIIVTHGTDTLQYSAAALSFALGCSTAPVVLVSSNYPLADNRTNGVDNFIAAVEFIKSGIGRGVFVSYKNEGETAKIYVATRLLSHNESFDFINSFDSEPFAEFNGKIIKNNNCIYQETDNYIADICLKDNSGVLVVQAMPGDDFSYSLDGVKAVILRPYHSGTLNTASQKLIAFCEKANSASIPVFVVNVHGNTTYETSKDFENLRINILPMCAFPAVYMKLWLADCRKECIKEYMLQNIANEYHNNA